MIVGMLIFASSSLVYAKKCGDGYIADDKICHKDEPEKHKGKPCGNAYIAKDKECHIGHVVKKDEKPVIHSTPSPVVTAPVPTIPAPISSQPIKKPEPEPETSYTPYAAVAGLLGSWKLIRNRRKKKQLQS